MKDEIRTAIGQLIKEYENKPDITTRWGEPLVGFADAKHPLILDLKETIASTHWLPSDVVKDASIVIAYFVPFTKALADTNRISKDVASPEWARAYEETNAMLAQINQELIQKLQAKGYQAGVSPEAFTFDQNKLISNWSHRHFAQAAGIGTFGINNMLITERGCCGRTSTVVTNLSVEPDVPLEKEYCIHKRNGTCGICVKHCPSGALSFDGFDRGKCYELLKRNAERYTEFGSSYTNETKERPNSSGSEVCGKCVVYAPCAFSHTLP